MRVRADSLGTLFGSAASGELSLGREQRQAAKSMADEASISNAAGAYSCWSVRVVAAVVLEDEPDDSE